MAGALNRRDIEMIFRAETDKATRPIGELTRDVKTLRSALEDQIKTAERGEVSLDKLASTTRDLKKAQEELGTARSLLTSLNGQVSALEKAEEKLTTASAKYNDLKNQVDAAEKPTKRLTNSMEAAGRAQSAAAESVERIGAEVAQTRAQIEGIIGPVTNFGDSFKSIADTSREIARGLAVAGAATDDFKAKLASLDAAQNKANADSAFQRQGQDAGLLQAQIDYISQFENRVELLSQAKKELATQNAAFDQALKAQAAKEGADNVDQLRRAFEATAAEQQRIEQVNAFRQIAADANAAATDVSRFGTTADTTSASATRLADAILAITAPAAAANQSLDGLENSVKTAASVLDGDGQRSLQQYNVAMGELAAANAAAVRIAKDVDGYRTQQEALARSTAAFEQAQREVVKLAADLAAADAPTDEMATALKRAEAALEAAGKEMQRDGNLAEQLGGKLRKAGVDVNDLTQAEQRLTQAAKEAAAAQGEIAGKTGGATNPFGFSLQDMQNLGYQVNDLITQVASGTPIAQAFAQQFGQIYQIPAMQNLIARFAVFIPLVAAAAVAVGVLVAVLNRAGNAAENLKNAEGYIARIGDGGDFTAQQIADATQALTDMGVAAGEAFDIITQLNEAGLDPSYVQAFTEAVRDAALATGVEIPEAAKLLTDALAGGYEEVAKLDDKFNFLTVSEREQIRAMYDSGQESEARRIVFERFYASMDEGAKKMRGTWSEAVRNFQEAWRGFLDYLGNTQVIKNTIRDLNNAAIGLTYLTGRLKGLSHEQAGQLAVNGVSPNAPAGRGGGGGAPRGDPRGGRSTGPTKEGQDAIADAQRELKARKLLTREERLRNAEIEARRKAPKGASDEERDQLAALARQKESNALAEEGRKASARGAKAAETARNKALREAEALQNKIEAAEESLQSGLDGMDAKVARVASGGITEALASAATEVDKQYDKLYRRLDDFAKLTQGKGTIGGLTIDAYRAQLDANKVILTQQAQLKVYEEQVNDVLNQRKTLLADIEERANRGAITSAQAIKESSEVTSRLNPVIQQLSTAAGAFATSIAGATPSPELQAFLDKMERINGQAAAGPMQSDVAKTADTRLGAEEAKLNQIIAERNNLISANNTLVELGLKTQADAQRDTAAAFANSQPMIAEQVRVIQQTLDLMRELGVVQPQVYDAWIAKLQAVTAQSTYTNENVLKLNNLVQNQLLQGGMNMFDSFAKGLAGLATGTMSVGEAFDGLLNTFLNFAATFLAEIAKMIIQALILKAIQSALGLPGGGGGLGGFFFHSGTDSVGGGSSRRTRSSFDLHPSMLAAVPRYHEGTQGAGLKNNEMVAVLERGEKVLTEEQQRQEAKKAAGGGDSGGGLRQVLAFGDDQVAAAMQGAAGEKVTVTHLRRNVPLIKQLLKD
jgi:uncharacterized protein YoxC